MSAIKRPTSAGLRTTSAVRRPAPTSLGRTTSAGLRPAPVLGTKATSPKLSSVPKLETTVQAASGYWDKFKTSVSQNQSFLVTLLIVCLGMGFFLWLFLLKRQHAGCPVVYSMPQTQPQNQSPPNQPVARSSTPAPTQ